MNFDSIKNIKIFMFMFNLKCLSRIIFVIFVREYIKLKFIHQNLMIQKNLIY